MIARRRSLLNDRVIPRPGTGEVIDATFRELPAVSSTSRAVIPVEQPYDSRVQAALRQHARAQKRPPGQGVASLSSPFLAALGNLFTADPAGDETLGALAAAWQENAAAMRAAEARDAHERQRRADVSTAEAAREAAQEQLERLEALQAISKLWTREPAPEPPPVDQTPYKPECMVQPEDDDADGRDPITDPDLDDFSYHERSSIDAIARQKTRSEPVESADDYDGDGDARTIDPRKLWQRRRPTFAERIAEARAEVAQTAAREKAAQAAQATRSRSVRELFARSKTKGEHGVSAQPEPTSQVPVQENSWWRHFATPKKAVCK